MQVSLGHSDKTKIRKSNHVPTEAKVKNQDSGSCACGNPGHLSLDKWYSSWGMSLGVDKWSLDDDLLDIEKCLKEIKSLVPLVQLVQGCCTDCRTLLDSIPAAIATTEPASQDQQEAKDRPLLLPYFPHVAACYASVVRGCKVCTIWEQQHPNPTRPWSSLRIVDIFKRENRLKCLGKDISFGVWIRIDSAKRFISTAFKSSNLSQSPDLSLFLTRPCVLQDFFRVIRLARLTMTGTDNRGMFLDPIDPISEA
jgi:hypothetical protein